MATAGNRLGCGQEQGMESKKIVKHELTKCIYVYDVQYCISFISEVGKYMIV